MILLLDCSTRWTIWQYWKKLSYFISFLFLSLIIPIITNEKSTYFVLAMYIRSKTLSNLSIFTSTTYSKWSTSKLEFYFHKKFYMNFFIASSYLYKKYCWKSEWSCFLCGKFFFYMKSILWKTWFSLNYRLEYLK